MTEYEWCKKYLQKHYTKLIETSKKGEPVLIKIPYTDIAREYDKDNQLPAETVLTSPSFQSKLEEAWVNLTGNVNNTLATDVKIIDFPETCDLRELDTKDRNKWISTTAMIKSITDPRPKIDRGYYKCSTCGAPIGFRPMVNNAPLLPPHCKECGGSHFILDKDSTIYTNYRLLRLEEPLEQRRGGSPRSFVAEVTGYPAGPYHQIQAGDVCKVTGRFNLETAKKKGKDELSFKVDIYHIEPVNSNYDELRLSEDEIKEIEELSKRDDIYDLLVASILPNVYGHKEVKKGIVLQLFEGDRSMDNDNIGRSTERHTIHILLLGEPGIGKSRILELIRRVAPKAIKSNGAGTSKAGITASAVKDDMTGSFTMEAGSMVLADNGLLTIDEFDKTSKDTMEACNEPMENQSVSVAKAGLVQTMTARTSVLAAANPEYGRWRDDKSFNEQVNIPDTTLSRFDLVYLIRDDVNYDEDLSLARKVLTRAQEDSGFDDLLDAETIRKYVNYNKLNINPVLSEEAIKKISKYYADVRKSTVESDGKPITNRELGALHRLTIAHARARGESVATGEHAQYAIEVYEGSLETLGLDIMHTGDIQNVYDDNQLKCIDEMRADINSAFDEYGKKIPTDDINAIIDSASYSYPDYSKEWITKEFWKSFRKVTDEM